MSGAGEKSVEMDVRSMGIDPKDIEETGELQYAITPRAQLLRNTLLIRARSWVGHHFRGEEKEQCANFIRRLLAESCLEVPAVDRPFDYNITAGIDQGPSFANSFFGARNGALLGFGDLLPGDLVAFRDTYEGDFPKGCITHVGLWASEYSMIDRATSGAPVRELVLNDWWKERFVVGLRPLQLLG